MPPVNDASLPLAEPETGRIAPLRHPRILRATALPGGPGTPPDPMAAILPGGWIALEGTALAAERMRVMLGARQIGVAAADIGDRRIDLHLPADQQAGIARAMVDHLFIPAPGQAERLWESSNARPFAVAPTSFQSASWKPTNDAR